MLDDTSHVPCVSLKVLMVTAFAKRFGEFQSPKGNLCLQKVVSQKMLRWFVKLDICCLHLSGGSAVDLLLIM